MVIKVRMSNKNSGANMYKVIGFNDKTWHIYASSPRQLKEKVEAKMMRNQIQKNTKLSKVSVEAVNFELEPFEVDLKEKSKSGFRGIM